MTRSAPSRYAQVPPWLWLWVALFLIGLPHQFKRLQQLYESNEGAFLASTKGPLNWTSAFSPLAFQAWPVLVLTAAVAFVAMPAVSGALVTRRHHLKPLSRTPGRALGEILRFLDQQAPGVAVTANLAEARHTAVVYPRGYRRSAIGIFGRLITTWQRDPVAGRGILLHEIAHYRQGDALLVNAGSPLLTAVAAFPWLLLATAVISFASFFRGISRELAGMLLSGDSIGPAALVLLNALPWLILLVFAEVLQPLALFLPLVIAIWCIEFNADRFALVSSTLDRQAYIAWLAGTRAERGWRARISRAVSHPPIRLRVWFAQHAEHWLSLGLILLLFPLAWFASILLGLSRQAIMHVGMGLGAQTVAGQLGPWLGEALAAAAPAFGAMAILVLAWFGLIGRFGSFPTDAPPVSRPAFAVAATLALLLASIGLADRFSRTVASSAPQIATDRPEYRSGEPIVIRFAGLPGNATDWINVVRAGAPPQNWGEAWAFTKGAREGAQTVMAGAPGEYEARVFFNWQEGGFVIHATRRFSVLPGPGDHGTSVQAVQRAAEGSTP